MEEKKYRLLIKETKEKDWEQRMKDNPDRNILERFAQVLQNQGKIFSAKVYEMPSEWLVFWI